MPLSRTLNRGRFHPEQLYRPTSIAVVGSETVTGAELLGNLRSGGFAGAILAAPRPSDIAGFEAAPDLAFIAGDGAVAAIGELGRRGIRTAVVVGPGDPAEIGAAARAARVRVYGPNSAGIAVPSIGLNGLRAHLVPRQGRAALVSQSVAIVRAVLDWAEPNGVGFSHIIGIGDNADLGYSMTLDWLSRDAGTGVILLDINRIRDPRRFLSGARAAARLRPVVAIRPGGRLLDETGDIDAAFHAALNRAGVLVVDTFEDLLAAAETLTRARQPRNEALAIVASEAGPAQLAADAAIREGLKLVEFEPETQVVLQLAGAETTEHYVSAVPAFRLAEIAALVAGAREVGGVLVLHVPRGEGDDVAIAGLMAAAKAIRAPLLVCAMGETLGAGHRRTLGEAGVAVFATPEQAVRGFCHLVQNRRNRAAARELPPSRVLRLAPDRAEVARTMRRVRASGRSMLTQDEAMGVLSAYGVPTAPSRNAFSADDAADAARILGFPVVLKRRRLDRPEGRTSTGLALDLHDERQVRRAAAMLDASFPDQAPLGFLVQRQVGRARELLIRVRPDPLLGPVIGFGRGGTAALLAASRDIAVDLPPLNLPLAYALIDRTRVAASLGPLRDAPAANLEAVAETLVRVSQLLIDTPDIAELDINPLFADSEGVVVADAWIRLRLDDETIRGFALPPYPTELTVHIERKGERFTIRPIRPEDAEAHSALFTRLTPEDIRYRFFSVLRELTAEQTARMTQIDYDREMALIAVREATGETVGVARLVFEGDSGEGEFAVVVQPDVKGRGLASELMRRIIDWGRTAGLREIVGQVLSDNAPMLAFVRHLGFALKPLIDDAQVMEARLSLRTDGADD